VGPTFKDLFNSKVTVIVDGVEKTVIADTAYIRSSIIDPDKEIVKGYNKGMMRAYKSVIKDEDIQTIIRYFENQKPTKQ
jgi:cytochrome c oxidase subunit 2